MSFCVIDFFLTALDVPFSPGSDDGHIGAEVLEGQLEANLIVALTGTAVADGICALGLGDFHQSLGNDGTGKSSTHQVLFINCTGLNGRNDYIIPCVQAGAKYEEYLLGTSHARPCIAKALAEIAVKEGADAVCHGCTGKGNDQVRFELAFKHFIPDMAIIAPWREWDIKSREEEIDYAEAHNVPLKINRETNYSKDKNLWHLSHEGLDLEDTGNEPQYEKKGFLEMGVSPIDAPDTPTYVEIEFVKGVPTAVNGKKMSPKDVVLTLNELGGKNGIGILDIVENRLVGMKCRGVYETPGGTILYKAHEVLETICLDKMTMHEKQKLSVTFAELVYNGQWFTPLREALSAFVTKTQENVTGKVKLKLYKGNIINAGVWSDYTLYSEEIATFGESDYNQKDADGFINLFGLPVKVQAMANARNKK